MNQKGLFFGWPAYIKVIEKDWSFSCLHLTAQMAAPNNETVLLPSKLKESVYLLC